MGKKLFLLFKQGMTSLASSVVDLIMFNFVYWLCKNLQETTAIVIATIVSRMISGIFNFLLTRNVVFKSKDNMLKTFPKYLVTNIGQMALSALLVSLVNKFFDINVTLNKCIVDTCLFFVCFFVQKNWVFKN